MVPVRSDEAEVAMDGECSAPAATARSGPSRSHSEAERKRRQRINAHLATLRTLLPAASRMDKAALLGEVVRHVRELRGEADAAAAGAAVAVPGEGDEVGVEDGHSWRGGERTTTRRVRAWVCCADRPGLMSELGRAVRSVSARAVRAEIATVGGRTRSVLELDVGEQQAAADGEGASSRPALQAALRAVLLSREELLASECYKRQRFSGHLTRV
ncbi:transcription factor bHLH30-like [Phragmites australis]|uniref:transcription factor bHLH30-like n=1 Tax=Phragmites australis TaxID=29695 RepID=UPI002D76D3AD|nr:transcription factor bHLH30-like [Phragmites australis]